MVNIREKLKTPKFWRKLSLILVIVPTLFLSVVVTIVYVNQDKLVQELIGNLNESFTGSTELKGSHISFFENFPYISIDLQDFKVYESKEKNTTPLVDVKDVYIGFDLLTLVTGKMEIKKIKLKNGKINLIQHADGEFNIVHALSSPNPVDSPEEEFHLKLKKIELINIDLSKLNEANNLKVEAFIQQAHSKFESSPDHVLAAFDARFILNLISNGDTTFFKHKHFDLETQLDFLKGKDKLVIQPTKVHLEDAEFDMKGSIDFANDMDLDFEFAGDKTNFNLLIALFPEELMHKMHRYENSGRISIDAKVKGKSLNGHSPAVNVDIACMDGIFTNLETQKSLGDLNFKLNFTNGERRNPSTMKVTIKDFSAKPENGKFSGDISAFDFTAPELDVKLQSEFNMDFVSKFLQMEHVEDLKGTAKIDLAFKDIIDLKNPGHAIAEIDEQYRMNIDLKDISFKTDAYHLPIENFNLNTNISGHKARISILSAKLGKSDFTMTGTIDDLPAIIHHTSKPVDVRLKVNSNYLDLFELGGSDSTAVNEQISGLRMDFDFKASAKSLTESKYLPVGEFFIEDFYAKLNHYPHAFHDFHADIFIDERDLRVVDFKGMIDKSDFLFTGKLEYYEQYFYVHPGGDSKIEFNLVSKILQLESLFTYKGDNYVPEEYRHEEFDNLKVHGFTYLHYDDGLKSMDLNLDKFEGKMKVHPLRFEKFAGRVHYENEHLVVEDFHGILGKSQFKTTLHYYLGKDEKIKKRDNHFSITASRLDVDQLIQYNPAPAIKSNNAEIKGAPAIDHDAGFNIYELPFTDMTYHIDIGHLNYHRFLFDNVKGKLRTTPNHYLYIDDLKMDAAGGHFDIKGYFNGSNPKLIYLTPEIYAQNVDLDKLMFKFENFGQDYILSENLHGKFTGKITGKIHMHNDLVPKIDDSEIHMDLDVRHGKLENYSLLYYMSDYFKDKNLSKVLFDTLNNHVDIKNGIVTIPRMKINSSLGHMEISGKQDLNGDMEYYLRIPWSMVSKTAAQKLFVKKKTEEALPDQEDEIQYKTGKVRYVNLKITGNEKGYKFSLGKDKFGK